MTHPELHSLEGIFDLIVKQVAGVLFIYVLYMVALKGQTHGNLRTNKMLKNSQNTAEVE